MCDKKIICKGACKLVNFDCMWVSTQDMIVASVYLLHTILQSLQQQWFNMCHRSEINHMFHDVLLSHKPIRQMLLLRVSVTFSLLSLGSMTSLSDQRNIK